jgi:hypothetical protein
MRETGEMRKTREAGGTGTVGRARRDGAGARPSARSQVRAVFSQVRLPVSVRQNPHQPAANQM